jgi:hypothetical protein
VHVLILELLRDGTDTTVANYGQLAGAVYGIEGILQRWRDRLFQTNFLLTLANGLFLKGKYFNRQKRKSDAVEDMEHNGPPNKISTSSCIRKPRIIPEYD